MHGGVERGEHGQAGRGSGWGVRRLHALYMTTDYVNSHKNLVQKLVNAYVATLAWIQGHTGAQIADMMPASYYAGVGKNAYAKALDN